MKATLAAFKVNKIVANVTWEVFQAAFPAYADCRSAPASAPSLALVLATGGSRSAASKTSVPSKASASVKTPPAPRDT